MPVYLYTHMLGAAGKQNQGGLGALLKGSPAVDIKGKAELLIYLSVNKDLRITVVFHRSFLKVF